MNNNDKDKAQKKQEEANKTTDPQEQMQGPISSLVQNVKETVEDNDKESKEEADAKKEGKV